MSKKNDPFYEKLFSLVLPITIQSFMLALVSATDAMMLGFVDQTSLSAVSLAGQIQFVLSLFVTGIAAGTGIMAAQYWGKGDCSSIEKVIPIALRMNLLFGGVFTAAALMLPQGLMRFLTNDSALIASGAAYVKAVALSYVLCGISQIYLTVLKNTGHANISSRISSCTVVLNIIVNAVLIFGLFGAPALGIVGAAYATVLSRAVELIWSMIETKRLNYVKVHWDRMLASGGELGKDFWRYTMPVLGASLVWGIAYTLYSVIMGHLGEDAVAAHSIASIAKSMLSCLIRGISSGTGIMVGNVLGCGDLELAKVYGRRLTKISVVVGVLTGGLLILLSPLIVRIAPMSETASGYLQIMLIICAFNTAAQSVNSTVLDGIFCAGGDSKFDMVGNVGAMWCFGVPLGFLTAFVFKLPVLAVYVIINLDEIVKLPAVFKHYKKYIWLRNITRD